MVDVQRLLTMSGMALCAYLVGSINLSILACKLLGIRDLRAAGSGNPGATNLLRVAGWQVAVPVLLLDIGKAAAVIWGARLLGFGEYAAVFALPLLLGNLFPAFHHFKGGKGVAAVVGIMLAIDPVAMLLGGLVFAVAVALGRRVSLGSLSMVLFYPLWMWIGEGPVKELVTTLTIALVILITHRSNMARLFRGAEPRIGEKKKDQP